MCSKDLILPCCTRRPSLVTGTQASWCRRPDPRRDPRPLDAAEVLRAPDEHVAATALTAAAETAGESTSIRHSECLVVTYDAHASAQSGATFSQSPGATEAVAVAIVGPTRPASVTVVRARGDRSRTIETRAGNARDRIVARNRRARGRRRPRARVVGRSSRKP